MFKQKKRLVIFILMVIVVFVGLWLYAVVPDYIASIFDDIPAPEVMWSAGILTWVDENENKVWDTGEAPLGDVEIFVVLAFEGHKEDIRFKSYWEGRRGFSTDIYGNNHPKTVEISVEPPDGYVLTTPSHVITDFDDRDEHVILFGFTYLPDAPTVTPLPPAPRCTKELEESITWDIAIAPDDTLWFATRESGVFHLDPSKNIWTNYTMEDGLASNFVRSVAVSSGNVAWFGTNAGITRFDGSSWTSFTTQDGLPYDHVVDVAITSEDFIWFVTRRGEAGHFSPDTNIWTTEIDYNYSMNITLSPDGSVWLSSSGDGKINQAIPITSSSQVQVSTTYRIESPFDCFDCSVGIEDSLPDTF